MKLKALAASAVFAAIGLGAVGTVAVVGSTEARADAPRLVKKYCRRDYKRFCPRYKIGSTRARGCMGANQRRLSSICKRALKATGYARKLGYRGRG